jgi:rhodanese-related sulfurtransferase
MHPWRLATAATLLWSMTAYGASGPDYPVGITADTMSVTVRAADGSEVEILRNQDNSATIDPDFAKTSRPCPPFCIQPDRIGAVESIFENAMLDYLVRQGRGEDVLVIDSRTPDWVTRGTIPGATNIPWTRLNPKQGATTAGIIDIMTNRFGVKLADGAGEIEVDEAVVAGDTSSVFEFANAKTLVMFCNGPWCGQSPANIRQLLKMGYPAEKLKWYRGGMQAWHVLGLTTVPGNK